MRFPEAAFLAALAASAGPAVADTSAPPSGLPPGLIELPAPPSRIATLPLGPGPLEVLLLRDAELERFRVEAKGPARVDRLALPLTRGRGILLDVGKAGSDLLAAVVVADDVQSIDEGTDSALHAWLVTVGEGGLRLGSGDLEGYLRIVGGKVLLQRRGRNEPYAAPVYPVSFSAGGFAPLSTSAPWARRWSLDATPFDATGQALAWEAGSRPVVVEMEGGMQVPGGSILGDLGRVLAPAVSVRLERPEYPLGFDKEGRVASRWHPLPRRAISDADGAIYTVARGRSKGLPILGSDSGEDSVVRLSWDGNRLGVSRPFPGVQAFIIDFALVPRPGRPPAAVVLVNRSADGSGRGSLLFQEPSPGSAPGRPAE